MVNVGFIGSGNMGTAIIKGISTSSLSDDINLFAYDKDREKVKLLEQYRVKSLGSEKDIISECKYVFLAVKPQIMENVLEEISDSVNDDTVLVSIAAGITSDFIRSKTKPNVKTILVMPNTPLLLGEGASALAKAAYVTDDEFSLILKIFSSCGEISVISEDKMKEIIAVNGSSPAFIYLFAKGFIDYAINEGIDEDTAKKLFAKSLVGSAKMITDSGNTIEELIKMVSSPGGTTLAGLDELYKGNLTDIVISACKACTKRAYELSK